MNQCFSCFCLSYSSKAAATAFEIVSAIPSWVTKGCSLLTFSATSLVTSRILSMSITISPPLCPSKRRTSRQDHLPPTAQIIPQGGTREHQKGDRMNSLQIFNNPEFGEIRTIQKDGEPWFVLKDVCRKGGEVLGNHHQRQARRDSRPCSGATGAATQKS